jgi:hypothetical protein
MGFGTEAILTYRLIRIIETSEGDVEWVAV